jgi:enoyl-CoA hydratase
VPDARVRLEVDGAIAVVTNDHPDRLNAFDDAMDLRLFEALAEIAADPGIRVVIWRAEGKAFSTGRDVSSIGQTGGRLSHHELMTRGHRGIGTILDLDIPIVVAMQGWAIGASFQRALLCDIRVASSDARFMLPEVGHGVIPDTGGVSRLYEMCGHGVVSDMVLTGRRMSADEALQHGVVSRVVARDELDATAREIAEAIAKAPAVTVKMARRVIKHLADPQVRSSMAEELIAQTFINKSDDYREMRAAREQDRAPLYTGS